MLGESPCIYTNYRMFECFVGLNSLGNQAFILYSRFVPMELQINRHCSLYERSIYYFFILNVYQN